jgi:hypothetical protein
MRIEANLWSKFVSARESRSQTLWEEKLDWLQNLNLVKLIENSENLWNSLMVKVGKQHESWSFTSQKCLVEPSELKTVRWSTVNRIHRDNFPNPINRRLTQNFVFNFLFKSFVDCSCFQKFKIEENTRIKRELDAFYQSKTQINRKFTPKFYWFHFQFLKVDN